MYSQTFKDGFDIDLGSKFFVWNIFRFFVRWRQSLFRVVYIQINSVAFEIDEISPHTSVEQAAPKKAINY